MTFTDLCTEVGEWSIRNFGDQPPENPLLGVLEEIGELSHAYLKSLQGIRGTPEEHLDALRDGVGDAVVFLADFCIRAGLVKSFAGHTFLTEPLGEVPVSGMTAIRPEKADARYYLFRAASTLDRMYVNLLENGHAPHAIHVEYVLHCLTMFCWMWHLSFVECVMTTWTLVKQRDWKANTQTGEAV